MSLLDLRRIFQNISWSNNLKFINRAIDEIFKNYYYYVIEDHHFKDLIESPNLNLFMDYSKNSDFMTSEYFLDLSALCHKILLFHYRAEIQIAPESLLKYIRGYMHILLAPELTSHPELLNFIGTYINTLCKNPKILNFILDPKQIHFLYRLGSINSLAKVNDIYELFPTIFTTNFGEINLNPDQFLCNIKKIDLLYRKTEVKLEFWCLFLMKWFIDISKYKDNIPLNIINELYTKIIDIITHISIIAFEFKYDISQYLTLLNFTAISCLVRITQDNPVEQSSFKTIMAYMNINYYNVIKIISDSVETEKNKIIMHGMYDLFSLLFILHDDVSSDPQNDINYQIRTKTHKLLFFIFSIDLNNVNIFCLELFNKLFSQSLIFLHDICVIKNSQFIDIDFNSIMHTLKYSENGENILIFRVFYSQFILFYSYRGAFKKQ